MGKKFGGGRGYRGHGEVMAGIHRGHDWKWKENKSELLCGSGKGDASLVHAIVWEGDPPHAVHTSAPKSASLGCASRLSCSADASGSSVSLAGRPGMLKRGS